MGTLCVARPSGFVQIVVRGVGSHVSTRSRIAKVFYCTSITTELLAVCTIATTHITMCMAEVFARCGAEAMGFNRPGKKQSPWHPNI